MNNPKPLFIENSLTDLKLQSGSLMAETDGILLRKNNIFRTPLAEAVNLQAAIRAFRTSIAHHRRSQAKAKNSEL
jgi:hypothetical protein